MKRRRIIIGILAAWLTVTAGFGTLGYGRIVSTSHRFRHASLGPVERLVYSLVLSNHQPAPKPPR